ncbi:MAG: P-type conjugative transfer protein TrbG [Desulfuromusa sp.]|nr:P-type conjugative transfer protein TrbG [Desulfuromusa sp.]
MKKKLITMVLVATLAIPAVSLADEMADKYFSKKNITLTPQEKAAIDIAKKYQTGSGTGMKPITGPDGSVRFLFGAQQPSIVCAPFQVCDIALQPGEWVTGLHLGDTVRWQVDPAITGSGVNEITHLVIKPLDVGLETGLFVATNRRSYHMKLRSHRTQYMSMVSFSYPEDSVAKWDALRKEQKEQHTTQTLQQTGEYLGDLSFEYELSGEAPWKPVRVYNDGVKTIIQMPSTMAQTEAPALMVLGQEGGLFSAEEMIMVNYRIQNNRYIIDRVFDKAILIAGVGIRQNRITINRRK